MKPDTLLLVKLLVPLVLQLAGLRTFKRLYMDLRRKGGVLSAKNVDKAIMEVLEVTGFIRLFKFVE